MTTALRTIVLRIAAVLVAIAGLATPRAWATQAPAPLAPAQGAPHHVAAIFMYHHVSNQVQPGRYARDLTVTPADFAAQLRWLQTSGCRVAAVDQLLADVSRSTAASCEAALTFDDGYADAATGALPVLRKFHDVATFYVATGFVGAPGHLTIAQLRLLSAAGMEIGAHTIHHVDLTTLSARAASAEADTSANMLRGWLGVQVASFAYPAGRFDAAVVRDVQAGGFRDAVTTQPGDVRPGTDPYQLPRYRIERGRGLALLHAVFAANVAASASPRLAHIARERIAGNDLPLAEDVAVAILARSFPEQVLKVHVLSLPSATVAGIVLSGVKFHATVDRARFASDIAAMVKLAMQQTPAVDEVDVWAIVPQPVPAGAQVSGDYAVPTSRTVFSEAALRDGGTGATYWAADFLR